MIFDELMRPKEFSQNYNIPIDTLEYYRKIGLLHPSQTQENGYSLYSHEDGHTLQMIRLLKLGGCSLREIKGLLREGGASNFVDYMETKRDVLLSRREECDRALQILDYYKLFRRTTLELALDELRIIKNPDTFYLLYTEVPSDYRKNKEYCQGVLLNHKKHCDDLPRQVLSFPTVTIHPKISRSAVDMQSIKGYCNYCIGIPVNPESYDRIDTNTFVTYMQASDKMTVEESVVDEMISYVLDSGYELAGDLYVVPFTERIMPRKESMYYCRLFIEVRRAG